MESAQASARCQLDRFIFVGVPQSGKTVFFITMMDLLRRRAMANELPVDVLLCEDEDLAFVEDSIEQMTAGKWPAQTVRGGVYEFEIKKRGLLVERTYLLSFHDHPGEVFLRAFGDTKTTEAGMSAYASDAETLRNEIRQSRGIIVIISAVLLHDARQADLRSCLFNLTSFIRESGNRRTQIAVVFTQQDYFFKMPDFDPESVFREQYADAWKKLSYMNTKYFFVSAVASAVVNDEGKRVPPLGYDSSQSSENLLDPLLWMMSLKKQPLAVRTRAVIARLLSRAKSPKAPVT